MVRQYDYNVRQDRGKISIYPYLAFVHVASPFTSEKICSMHTKTEEETVAPSVLYTYTVGCQFFILNPFLKFINYICDIWKQKTK